MKKSILLLIILAFAKAVTAQTITPPTLGYYLPDNVTYNPEISTPQEVLGYVPGEWHVTHDKLIEYMRTLARESDRISIENRGSTYEGRPLVLLTITSVKNQENLDQIQADHVALTEGSTASTANMPIVVYQGFSIHGNEPSGSNAALLLAYHLAAGQGPEVEQLLDNTIILFDPSFNPDGLQRFAGWVNQHKSKNVNPDSYDREYDEAWPGGRTNHYWFDMNRDWLPVQLPESQARIETFHNWMPNILTDHHEMGTNATFFFQPGIPSRTHPLTPKMNQQLTREIGNYHAAELDKIGSLYYTEESYDDFYYGKGSTFPDINGSIGILFEQASSRGHAQNSDNGVLTFPFTIRNQFTAGISTLKAAAGMRQEILDYQRQFYKDAKKEATSGAIIFGDHTDAGRTDALADILLRHKIEVRSLKNDVTKNGKTYKKDYAYIVPKNQKNSRLINAMFEKRTTFQDSLFYDISAWTFPLAFDMDYDEDASLSDASDKISEKTGIGKITVSDYAYLMPWNEYKTPMILNILLEEGVRAKVAMERFTIEGKSYDYGTILIPVQNQKWDAGEFADRLGDISIHEGIDFHGVQSGLTTGIDLGSRQFRALKQPKIALLIGDGINPYDAGEIWHLLDQRYDITVTKIDLSDINRKDLSRYNTIIVPNTYGSPENEVVDQLKEWTRSGGTLIGYRSALRWMSSSKLLPLQFKKTENPAKDISFEQRSDFYGAQNIGGAIFETKLDRSHPIAFGFKDDQLPMFRNTRLFIEPHKDSFRNPITYTNAPLMSGYISDINLEALKNTVPFQHNNYGRGDVIGFTDNTQFRAFWYGTNKLLMNAIFFAEEM
ncbi:zinc carboxypeptidase [Nonlabens dokdonensis]|uniref:Zinc carboxypeptidase n=2 Tax=Nonlabens dokdonensis TaxID=328515 RepID=A0ABX5PZK6_9FLAO|nr:M14 family metallopeptidase [Nonlabens dokdonensis]AGC75539.1 putative peptidase [Nonlabens dokdonensis DSW-6]PZX43233.1 zinc carboxypeptidase [Nonlabens dokdonensis]